MRDFSTLPQLQKLCLMKTAAVTSSGGLACLTVLQRLTSLTMERIENAGMQLVASVLSSLTSLRHFAVTFPVPAWAALCLVECLAHVPAIHVDVGRWWPNGKTDAVTSSGGPQEVKLALVVVLGRFKIMCFAMAPFELWACRSICAIAIRGARLQAFSGSVCLGA